MNETKGDNKLFQGTLENADAMERMAQLDRAGSLVTAQNEQKGLDRDIGEASLLTASPGQEKALEDRSQRLMNSQLTQLRREGGVNAARQSVELQKSALQKQRAVDQTRIAVRRAKMNAELQRRAAKKEAKRSFWQGLATVGGAALGFVASGGNPAGAMVGAKLGGAGGSALGGR